MIGKPSKTPDLNELKVLIFDAHECISQPNLQRLIEIQQQLKESPYHAKQPNKMLRWCGIGLIIIVGSAAAWSISSWISERFNSLDTNIIEPAIIRQPTPDTLAPPNTSTTKGAASSRSTKEKPNKTKEKIIFQRENY